MLAIILHASYTHVHMKVFIATTIIAATIGAVVFFDAIVVFLLSGFIPGINITLAPSTMIAVFVASALLVLTLKKRYAIYRACLAFYDELFNSKKKTSKAPAKSTQSKLPRRRYQEL